MAERPTIQDFAPHLHTCFGVAQVDDYELELTEVSDLSNERLEQFSLIFTGIATPWLEQRIYKLIHPQMGECELFLVPLGPDAAGMRYQAAFSRLIEAPGAGDGS